MEIIAKLEKIGLGRQEAEVYLSTLKLGLAKASEIARKSRVKREASYYTLKLLNEKGFISEIIKSGVKYYSAVSPKRLLLLIDEEKQRKAETIKDILPELEGLQKTAIERPIIEYFEGFEGLKTAASKLLEKENQVIYCYIVESILHFIPYFHPQFRRRRKEKKVRLKVIAEKTKFLIDDLRKKDKEEFRETRFNDIVKDMDSCYYILDDAVLILKANTKEQAGIYIKEPSTAKLQRKIFEKMWEASKD